MSNSMESSGNKLFWTISEYNSNFVLSVIHIILCSVKIIINREMLGLTKMELVSTPLSKSYSTNDKVLHFAVHYLT